MIYDLASTLLWIGIVLFCVALVALWRPSRWVLMARRRSAVIGLCLSVASCVAGGALLPPVPKDQAAPTPLDTAAAPQAPTPGAIDPVFAAAVKKLNGDTLKLVDECDAAGRRVSQSVADVRSGRSSMVYAYEMDDWGGKTCHQVWDEIGDIELPPAPPSPHQSLFKDEIETCRMAVIDKIDMLDKLKAVLNGDDRPSAMADLDAATSDGVKQNDVCAAEIAAAAALAGIPATENPAPSKSKHRSKR